MSRSLAIVCLGFIIMLLGAGALMIHPAPEALFIAAVPSGQKLAVMLSAMTFVVAAVIEHDR
jgi:hypothetical protein